MIICVFCLDLVLAFKLREGWRRDVGSPFFMPFWMEAHNPLAFASFHN